MHRFQREGALEIRLADKAHDVEGRHPTLTFLREDLVPPDVGSRPQLAHQREYGIRALLQPMSTQQLGEVAAIHARQS